MLGRWLGAGRRAIGAHRGWSGFVAGTAAGVAAALLATQVVLPQLRHSDLEQGGELVILSGVDDGSGGQREQLIRKWNAMGGGRPKARIEIVRGDTNAQRAEMVARAQGDGPPVDIYNLDVILMEEFRKFGYIKALEESRIADLAGFLENPMRTCRDAGGTLWALPFNTDAALLYYRDDLPLPQSSPNSLSALGTAIKHLFAQQPGAVSAGYAGQLAEYEGLTVNAIEAIWAAGGRVVDDDGNVVIDSPQARNALKWMAEGLRPGNPQVILPDSRNHHEAETAQAFADGKVAFMRNWPVWYNRLADLRDASGKPKLSFRVAPLPGRSVLGGQNLAITTSSPRPRAAQALIEFLTSPFSQHILFERGGFAATRHIVYQDDAVRAKYPYTDQLLAAVNGADLRPETAYYAQFSQVLWEGVSQAIDSGGEWPPGFTAALSDALHGIRH